MMMMTIITSNTKKHLLVSTRDKLPITLYLQSEINFCSVKMHVNA